MAAEQLVASVDRTRRLCELARMHVPADNAALDETLAALSRVVNNWHSDSASLGDANDELLYSAFVPSVSP
jgi:hypothetical protein